MMAAERGIIVGAREARFRLKRVGVRPEREKGVDERGARSIPSAGDADATRVWSDNAAVAGRGTGLVERGSLEAARLSLSCSETPVLEVLLFVIPPSLRPTTVPYIDPRRLA